MTSQYVIEYPAQPRGLTDETRSVSLGFAERMHRTQTLRVVHPFGAEASGHDRHGNQQSAGEQKTEHWRQPRHRGPGRTRFASHTYEFSMRYP